MPEEQLQEAPDAYEAYLAEQVYDAPEPASTELPPTITPEAIVEPSFGLRTPEGLLYSGDSHDDIVMRLWDSGNLPNVDYDGVTLRPADADSVVDQLLEQGWSRWSAQYNSLMVEAKDMVEQRKFWRAVGSKIEYPSFEAVFIEMGPKHKKLPWELYRKHGPQARVPLAKKKLAIEPDAYEAYLAEHGYDAPKHVVEELTDFPPILVIPPESLGDSMLGWLSPNNELWGVATSEGLAHDTLAIMLQQQGLVSLGGIDLENETAVYNAMDDEGWVRWKATVGDFYASFETLDGINRIRNVLRRSVVYPFDRFVFDTNEESKAMDFETFLKLGPQARVPLAKRKKELFMTASKQEAAFVKEIEPEGDLEEIDMEDLETTAQVTDSAGQPMEEGDPVTFSGNSGDIEGEIAGTYEDNGQSGVVVTQPDGTEVLKSTDDINQDQVKKIDQTMAVRKPSAMQVEAMESVYNELRCILAEAKKVHAFDSGEHTQISLAMEKLDFPVERNRMLDYFTGIRIMAHGEEGPSDYDQLDLGKDIMKGVTARNHLQKLQLETQGVPVLAEFNEALFIYNDGLAEMIRNVQGAYDYVAPRQANLRDG